MRGVSGPLAKLVIALAAQVFQMAADHRHDRLREIRPPDGAAMTSPQSCGIAAARLSGRPSPPLCAQGPARTPCFEGVRHSLRPQPQGQRPTCLTIRRKFARTLRRRSRPNLPVARQRKPAAWVTTSQDQPLAKCAGPARPRVSPLRPGAAAVKVAAEPSGMPWPTLRCAF